jgi:outer membrane protein TolC
MNARLLLPVAAFATFLLSGEVLGQPPEGPGQAPESPGQGPESPDQPPEGPVQAPADVPERFQFDEDFGDGHPTLSAAKAADLAEATAPELSETRSAIDESEAVTARTRVGLAPRLDLSAAYSRIGGFDDGTINAGPGGPSIGIEVPRNRYGLRARASYPVTKVVTEVLPTLRSARAREEAERLSHRSAVREVRLRAVTAFYGYVEARGRVAVSRASVEQARQQLEQAERSVRAGRSVRADVDAARARLARAEDEQARASGALAVQRTSLEALIGLEAEPEFAVATSLAPAGSGPLEDDELLVRRARSQRAEVRALEDAIGAQAEREAAASGQLYPQLVVYGQTDYARPNPNVVPPEDEFQPSWEVGAQVTWSPNDFASGRRRARQNAAARRGLEAQLERLQRAVRVEVQQAYERVRQSKASMRAAEAGLEAAEEAYRARRARLAAGQAVITDVLLADAEVTRARLSLLRAQTELRVARAELARAVGEPVDAAAQ